MPPVVNALLALAQQGGADEPQVDLGDGDEGGVLEHPFGELVEGVRMAAEDRGARGQDVTTSDEDDDPDFVRSAPISFDQLRQLDPTAEMFNKEHRIFQAPLLDATADEEVTADGKATFLDYTMFCGRPCTNLFVLPNQRTDARYTMTLRRSDWARPLRLKSHSLPFLTTFATYFLGTSDLGHLFIIWTSPNAADAEADEAAAAAAADEDGRSSVRTAVKKGHADAITRFIEEIFATTDDLKHYGVRPIASEDLSATWTDAKLTFVALTALCSAFMKTEETKLRPHLGTWGARKVPRLVLYTYGQNERLPPEERALFIQNTFGNIISPDLEVIAASWATEQYFCKVVKDEDGNVVERHPLGILVDFEVARKGIPTHRRLTTYPLAFMKNFGNIQATRPFSWIQDDINTLNEYLSNENPGVRALVKFVSLNFYSLLKECFRATPKQFMLGKGSYTRGLGLTPMMVTPAQWNSKHNKEARTSARSLAPEKEFLASLKNTTSKNTGIRLEYTVAVSVGQLPEENRNWQYYAEEILAPTTTFVERKSVALVTDEKLCVLLAPKTWPEALVVVLRPLFDAIGRIVDQLGDHESSTASLAQRECIATLERLLFYGVTGSPRAIIRVWENVGLRDALLRDRFPYFKLDRFNPFTGHVDFQFYGKSRLAEYAHLAAIKFQNGDLTYHRAVTLAMTERAVARQQQLGSSSLSSYAVEAFVRQVLLTEMVKHARLKYIEWLESNHKKALVVAASQADPGDRFDSVEDAHNTYHAGLNNVTVWSNHAHPFSLEAVLKLFHTTFPPSARQGEHIFHVQDGDADSTVLRVVNVRVDEEDQEVHELAVPTSRFSSVILHPQQIARHLLAVAFKRKYTSSVDDALVTTPERMQWPGSLRNLLPIEEDYTGEPPDSSGAPPATSARWPADELEAALTNAIIKSKIEVWPSRFAQLNNQPVSFKVLHYVHPTAIQATDSRVAVLVPNGNMPAVVDAPTTVGDRIARKHGLAFDMPATFPTEWYTAKAGLLDHLRDRIKRGTATTQQLTRWTRILNALNATSKSHWFIYTISRIWALGGTNRPWIDDKVTKAPGGYTKSHLSPVPPSAALNKNRVQDYLLALFAGLLLVYREEDLQMTCTGECDFDVLVKGFTNRKLDTAVFAAFSLGEQVKRGRSKFVDPRGKDRSTFVPRLADEDLEPRWDRLVNAWQNGAYHYPFRIVYNEADSLQLIRQAARNWTPPP